MSADRVLDPVAPELVQLEERRAKSLPLGASGEGQSEFWANETPAARKARFEVALAEAGLGGHGQARETARVLGIKRTTLIGRRNPKALDRLPTDQDFETLRAYAEMRRLMARFSRSA